MSVGHFCCWYIFSQSCMCDTSAPRMCVLHVPLLSGAWRASNIMMSHYLAFTEWTAGTTRIKFDTSCTSSWAANKQIILELRWQISFKMSLQPPTCSPAVACRGRCEGLQLLYRTVSVIQVSLRKKKETIGLGLIIAHLCSLCIPWMKWEFLIIWLSYFYHCISPS